MQAGLLLIALAAACSPDGGSGSSAGSREAAGPHAVEPASRPSVLLVTFDTLRADRVGCYGFAGDTTPHWDALAARGLRFSRAWAVAPITLPSHTSMLTGVYPPVHGVRDNALFRVSEESDLVAEPLARAGWRTGAFVASMVLDEKYGLAQGFEVYDAPTGRTLGSGGVQQSERRADVVVDAALEWFGTLAPDEPFFAWVHFYDPHASYSPPEPYRSRHADPYDGEIAFADAQLGRLLQGLADQGRDERLFVLATADHGESLGEHGEESHGLFIYDSSMRVPLVVAGPGLEPGVETRPVSVADVAPTVLQCAGLAADTMPSVRVPSLLAGRLGDDTPPSSSLDAARQSRAVYLESWMPWHFHRWHPLQGIVLQDHKLIESPAPEVFALGADPGELHNGLNEAGEPTSPVMAERLADLRRGLQALRQAHAPLGWGQTLTPSSEEQRQLAQLGYTGSAAGGDPFDPDLPVPRQQLQVLDRHFEARELIRRGLSLMGRDPDPTHAADMVAMPDPAERERVGYGSLVEARALLGELVSAHPGDPSMLYDLGFTLMQLGETRDALGFLERSAVAAPADPSTRYWLAQAYAAAGRLDWAAAEMTKAAALDPGAEAALRWLVNWNGQAGRHGRALWWLQRLAAVIRPGTDAATVVATHIVMARGEMESAGQVLNGPAPFPPTDPTPAGLAAVGDRDAGDAR